MLETILEILGYIWIVGVVISIFLVFIIKWEDGKTVIDMSLEKALEEVPVSARVIAPILVIVALFLALFWPLTIILMLTKNPEE